jgi:hypothetical protein
MKEIRKIFKSNTTRCEEMPKEKLPPMSIYN